MGVAVGVALGMAVGGDVGGDSEVDVGMASGVGVKVGVGAGVRVGVGIGVAVGGEMGVAVGGGVGVGVGEGGSVAVGVEVGAVSSPQAVTTAISKTVRITAPRNAGCDEVIPDSVVAGPPPEAEIAPPPPRLWPAGFYTKPPAPPLWERQAACCAPWVSAIRKGFAMKQEDTTSYNLAGEGAKPLRPISRLYGSLRYDGPAKTLEDMEEGIAAGACDE